MTEKKCVMCSHVILGNLLQKNPSQIHAQENESLSHDIIHSGHLAPPKRKTKRGWLSRIFGGRNNEKKDKNISKVIARLSNLARDLISDNHEIRDCAINLTREYALEGNPAIHLGLCCIIKGQSVQEQLL